MLLRVELNWICKKHSGHGLVVVKPVPCVDNVEAKRGERNAQRHTLAALTILSDLELGVDECRRASHSLSFSVVLFFRSLDVPFFEF